MSLWTRVHAFATHTRREVLTYAVTKEAQRRGWTPDQVRREVEAAGGKREGDVAHRYGQVQPTQDGLEFWHTERQQYGPNWPREMTGEPLPAYKAERREPTAAELWREQHAPGPLGYQAGDRRWGFSFADKLTYSGRWARDQDIRLHPCGQWVATGPKAHEHHACREVPGYIDAMHEDAAKENERRDAEAVGRDAELEQMLAAADDVLGERDGRQPAAEMPDLEAG